MRLPSTAHTSRPWRIHELTRDFRVEDVWALPTPGTEDDFDRLVRLTASLDAARSSATVRALFALRWKLGALFGLDRPQTGLGSRVPSLRDRLPQDLRDGAPGPDSGGRRFTSLYRTDDEWALEIANQTMHGVLHLGWVADPERGGHRGQMAVLVKRNGPLGAAYMAAIAPVRHLVVYPAMLRGLERAWSAAPETVRQIAVPPDARALSTLARVDYADAFMLECHPPHRRSPEQWARGISKTLRPACAAGCSRAGRRSGSSSAPPGPTGSSSAGRSSAARTTSCCSAPARASGCPPSCCSSASPAGCCSPPSCSRTIPSVRALWAGTESVHVSVVRQLLEDAG